MKKLLIGNEAVALGLYHGGIGLVSSYPGTPSTEIPEIIGKLSLNDLPYNQYKTPTISISSGNPCAAFAFALAFAPFRIRV